MNIFNCAVENWKIFIYTHDYVDYQQYLQIAVY